MKIEKCLILDVANFNVLSIFLNICHKLRHSDEVYTSSSALLFFRYELRGKGGTNALSRGRSSVDQNFINHFSSLAIFIWDRSVDFIKGRITC